MSEMPRRPLGRTGWEVSALGLGCASYWARPGFPEGQARAVFEAALECGITLFDTGASYAGGEAERRLGRLLRASPVPIDQLTVATKAGKRAAGRGRIIRDFSSDGIVEQVHQSLKRLGLERITLIQLHGPAPGELTDELLTALDQLRMNGKLRFIGVNATADVLEHVVGRAPFDVVMPFVSVTRAHNVDVVRRAADSGQGVLAAEPLARMRFAPPLARWMTSRSGLWYIARALLRSSERLDVRRRRCLRNALDAPGWSPAQLALGWVLAQSEVSAAVFGTTRPKHVGELALACTRPLPKHVADAVAACNRELPADPQ